MEKIRTNNVTATTVLMWQSCCNYLVLYREYNPGSDFAERPSMSEVVLTHVTATTSLVSHKHNFNKVSAFQISCTKPFKIAFSTMLWQLMSRLDVQLRIALKSAFRRHLSSVIPKMISILNCAELHGKKASFRKTRITSATKLCKVMISIEHVFAAGHICQIWFMGWAKRVVAASKLLINHLCRSRWANRVIKTLMATIAPSNDDLTTAPKTANKSRMYPAQHYTMSCLWRSQVEVIVTLEKLTTPKQKINIQSSFLISE